MARTATSVRDFDELGPVALNWTARYRLFSEAIDQDFQIDVSRPLVPLAAGERLPVIFVLDGNHAFAMVSQAARMLQSPPFPMPPAVVVGIGYHFERREEHAQWASLRVRDFTPCGDALFDEQYGAGLAVGGAEAFLAFIEDELTPFLAERLPVDVADRTLVGTSLGGLFALYAVTTRPGAFRRCVAISPALYWGQGRLFELEAAHAQTGRDAPLSLFLAAGGLEEAHDARCGLVSNVFRLDSVLRARGRPGLDLAMKIFEGENHMSVFPGAVTRGLGHVFGGYPDMTDWARALPPR